MPKPSLFRPLATLVAGLLLVAACAPAAQPSPTAAPAKPAATTAPAKPAEKAAEKPAAKPAEKASEKPAEKAAAKPAASPAAAKPAASPAAKADTKTAPPKPAAKAAFDEQAVADFYRGKSVRIVVGFAAGGGFDTYSRLIAKHMGKHIPGNPNVIVENMPGASSMLALNHVYNAAPKDGTTIANTIGTLATQQLFQAQGVEYDLTKAHHLGAPNQSTYVGWMHQRSGITKFEQVVGPNAKEVVLGADAPGSTVTDGPTMLIELLGAKFKLVQGYAGTSKIRLAIDSGEVDGFFNTWDSMQITNLEDVRNGVYVPIIQLNVDRIQAPEMKDVPNIMDVAKDPEHQQLLKFGVDSPNKFLRMYTLAPEVPADRVAALQDAFMKTLDDPELKADAQRGKLDLGPLTGDQVRQMVVEYLGMPADLKEKLQRILLP